MATSGKRRLCALADIPEGGARGFGSDSVEDLFAVRRDGRVYVYRNCCPHAGTPLNWMPHRFLTADKREIICATHGARFDIPTGRCTAGPCPGRSLTSHPCEVRDGDVWVSDE